MTATEDPPIYRALMAVKPPELKLGPWAEKAGLARNYFNGLQKHGKPGQQVLERLLDAIGVSPAQFEAIRHPVGTEVAGVPDGLRDITRAFYGKEPLPALPLLGTATGGEYKDLDEEIELTELIMHEVLMYLARPASLASDRDAYALTIVGVSMKPRYKPQEQVAVSPRAPVAIGDDVIVQLRGAEGDDERIKMVLIKELVRRTGTHIELRQYNPDITFRVDANASPPCTAFPGDCSSPRCYRPS